MTSPPRFIFVFATVAVFALSVPPVLAAVDPSECTLEIHNMIEERRRLELTLGEQTDLKAAFLDYGEQMARGLKLSGSAKIAQDALKHAIDTGRLAGDVGNKLDEADYAAAMADIAGFLADRVAAGRNKSWVVNHFSKKMTPGKREELRKALGRTLDEDSPFLKALEEGQKVNVAVLLGNLSTEQYHEAAKAFTMYVAEKAFPPIATLQKALDAVHVAGASGRDWVANEQVAAMYAAYKTTRDDPYDPRSAFDLHEGTVYTGVAEQKTREMMWALGKGVDPVSKERLHISDGEVQDFLFDQFEAWFAQEKAQTREGDRLTAARQSYFTLRSSCRDDLDWYLRPERHSSSGWTSSWFDECHTERERFKTWAHFYGKSYAELRRWYRPGSRCSSVGMFDVKVQGIICAHFGDPDRGIALRTAFQRALEDCGWLPAYELRVVDGETGAPVSGAYVRVESERLIDRLGESADGSAVTGPAGIARIENLPLGVYGVLVGAEGYHPPDPGELELRDQSSVSRTVRLWRDPPPVRTASLRAPASVTRVLPIDPEQCGYQPLAQWDDRAAGGEHRGVTEAAEAASGPARRIEVPGPGRLRVTVGVTGTHEVANNRYGAQRYKSKLLLRSDKTVMGNGWVAGGEFYPGVRDYGENSYSFRVKGPGAISLRFVPESCSIRIREGEVTCWTLSSTKVPGIKLLPVQYDVDLEFDPCGSS
jgi:hypothetical protein